MSDAAANPFQGPNYEPAAQAKELGPAKRPTGLLIFCVLILALASLGFLGALVGGIMLAVNRGEVDYKQQLAAQPNVELNPEVVPKLDQLKRDHASMYVAATIAALVASVLLIVGCIGAIYPWRSGGAILTIALIAAILYLVAYGVVMSKAYGDVAAVIKDHPDDLLLPKGDADERVIEMMNWLQPLSIRIIPIVTWVLNGLKIVFYSAVLLYLRKPNVRAFISGTPV